MTTATKNAASQNCLNSEEGVNFISDMKTFYFRSVVFLLTLTSGVVAAQVLRNLPAIRQEGLERVLTVVTAPMRPRFIPSFRGCGMGYTQDYITNDGYILSEGNADCDGPVEVIQTENGRIISKLDVNGKTYFRIHKDVHCITAPTLEMAVEFENYLNDLPE